MGETVLPIVEETAPQETEPPIGGLNGLNSSSHHQRQHQPKSAGDSPSLLNAPHTLSFEEVAEALRVDIK
jgi:hypothetical protein